MPGANISNVELEAEDLDSPHSAAFAGLGDARSPSS